MSTSDSDQYDEATWDDLRKRFGDSPLKDMELANLGQNAGISWPFKGRDETPAKYLGYNFEELQCVPGLVGKKSRIRALFNILIETLAFDDPFGEMADRVETGEIKDETIEHHLRQLGIPREFPLGLICLGPETIERLEQAGAATLGDGIELSEKGDPLNPLSEEFEGLIRAIGNKDEETVSRFLPYRKGGRGLHLAEAVSGIAEKLESPLKLTLMENCGFELEGAEHAEKDRMGDAQKEACLKRALSELEALESWFTEEVRELRAIFASKGRPERFFLALNDPARERLAIELAEHQWGRKGAKKGGFLGRLFGKS
ncbi:MAG: hypothetical protein ACLFS1_02290 [Opitutales bacterium]